MNFTFFLPFLYQIRSHSWKALPFLYIFFTTFGSAADEDVRTPNAGGVRSALSAAAAKWERAWNLPWLSRQSNIAADEDVRAPGKLYFFFTFSLPKSRFSGFRSVLPPSNRGRAHAAPRREWR
jgi:hypothetical protein